MKKVILVVDSYEDTSTMFFQLISLKINVTYFITFTLVFLILFS